MWYSSYQSWLQISLKLKAAYTIALAKQDPCRNYNYGLSYGGWQEISPKTVPFTAPLVYMFNCLYSPLSEEKVGEEGEGGKGGEKGVGDLREQREQNQSQGFAASQFSLFQ